MSFAQDDVKLIVNEKEVKLDVPPKIQNGRTLVPLRAIFEAMGATVEWDGETGTITGTKGDTKIVLILNSTEATVNNKKLTLDTPATSINGRTLVPARFIAESLGMNVDWDKDSRSVVVKEKNNTIMNVIPEVSPTVNPTSTPIPTPTSTPIVISTSTLAPTSTPTPTPVKADFEDVTFVVTNNGYPVQGASINIETGQTADELRDNIIVKTDENGKSLVQKLPCGVMRYHVYKQGCDTNVALVGLHSNSESINVALSGEDASRILSQANTGLTSGTPSAQLRHLQYL